MEAALAKMSPEARHKYHQLKSGITYDDVHHDEDVEASKSPELFALSHAAVLPRCGAIISKL